MVTYLIIFAVPVIAIFTKYDLVITRLRREIGSVADLHERADTIVQKTCITPFERVVQKQVPHKIVSGKLHLN
jgi:hypothetical protein